MGCTPLGFLPGLDAGTSSSPLRLRLTPGPPWDVLSPSGEDPFSTPCVPLAARRPARVLTSGNNRLVSNGRLLSLGWGRGSSCPPRSLAPHPPAPAIPSYTTHSWIRI